MDGGKGKEDTGVWTHINDNKPDEPVVVVKSVESLAGVKRGAGEDIEMKTAHGPAKNRKIAETKPRLEKDDE